MMDLRDQTVLVVGGSSGIGRATAAAAFANGATVTVAGRSADRLADVMAELPSARSLVLDVRDEGAVSQTLADAGQFDHVVVTAGSVSPAPIRDTATAAAMRGFDTKFWGAYRIAAHARFAERGSLTLVSGVFAIRPAPGHVAAACVNAAVEALARGLALELAPVRVNAVSPGLVDTPLWAGMSDGRRAAMFDAARERLPSCHVGQPEDIAALILGCMINPMLTGSVIVADGGHVLT